MPAPPQPLLANGINLPFVLILGIGILLPLLLFQVTTEAWILSRCWKTPFRPLTRLTLLTNLWSVLAGIPTKILNLFIAYHLLPPNLPSAFHRYPLVAAITTLTYFVVTVLTETAVAKRWLHHPHDQPILKPILLANLATYIVLAPLYYAVTRPISDIQRYTHDVTWTLNPQTRILLTQPDTHHLQSLTLNSTTPQTLVTNTVLDYLVSTNLQTCLYRTTSGQLLLQHQDQTHPIWKTQEKFFMDQVAFSPSATLVAYVSHSANSTLTITNLSNHTQVAIPVKTDAYDLPSIAWSSTDNTLYLRPSPKAPVSQIQISPSGIPQLLPLPATHPPQLLECYGRTGDNGRSYAGSTWGYTFHRDTNTTLTATARPGLGSHLNISTPPYTPILRIAFNPGTLHLSTIPMNEVALLPGNQECLLQAGQYIYLIQIPTKTLGTIAPGSLPVILNLPRYKKTI
jgi:hypothetical protein